MFVFPHQSGEQCRRANHSLWDRLQAKQGEIQPLKDECDQWWARLSKIAQNPSITTHNKKDYRERHNFLIIKVIYTHLGGIKMVGGES